MLLCVSCKALKPNVKVLIIAIVLFASITVVQFFAAIIGHSNALLVDCASMLVDTGTYVGNLYSECLDTEKSDELSSARRALISSGLSLLVLYGITGWGLWDAVSSLTTKHLEDDLEPGIVLGFGIGGVIFDGLTLLAFRRLGEPASRATPAAPESDDGDLSRALEPESEACLSHSAHKEASAMNMCSAFSHVIADTIRSVTSILLGLVVLFDHTVNGSRCDAYATLVVSSTILFGNSALVAEWCKALRDYRAARGASKLALDVGPETGDASPTTSDHGLV